MLMNLYGFWDKDANEYFENFDCKSDTSKFLYNFGPDKVHWDAIKQLYSNGYKHQSEQQNCVSLALLYSFFKRKRK